MPVGMGRAGGARRGGAAAIYGVAVGTAILLCLAGCTGKSNTRRAPAAATTGGAAAASAMGTVSTVERSSSLAVSHTASATSSGTSSGTVGSGQASGASLITAIRQVAQQVKPAVVQITNEQVQPDQFGGVAQTDLAAVQISGSNLPAAPGERKRSPRTSPATR